MTTAPQPTVTEAVDDYLKAIFELAEEGGRASTASIARKLEIAPASVTGMLRKLAEQDPPWIAYEKHRGAVLTDRGRQRALEIIRHHRLIESYLHHTLGYSWDEVHDEAEKLEHAISEQFEERIAEALGDPQSDPHGHPIPRKDGSMPERNEIGMLELEVGAGALISRVSDRDPELLRYFSRLGVRPGVRLELVERSPFDGPLLVRLDGATELTALGNKICREIHVSPDGPTEEP
ncbi:MAG: metal-dependent transcriptional regulator [Acidobacteria bacterium]|nr:metal-dependent transcriptional regulator [Acidobacteriota bacterium]